MSKLSDAHIEGISAPTAPQNEPSFFVAGIGASNHCLQFLELFLTNLKAIKPISYVLLQPALLENQSIMGMLIEKFTPEKVLQIENDMEIQPNCFYYSNPDETLIIDNNRFYSVPDTSSKETLHPIDFFLRSLAENFREKSIGIIFSENTCDGTQGCQAIKAHGGMVMMQDKTCQINRTIPCSAVSTGIVDFILPADKMPAQLNDYIKQRNKLHNAIQNKKEKADEDWFKSILRLLFETAGIDFSYYKPKMLERKIERRSSICKCKTTENYAKYLSKNSDEVKKLSREILLNSTKFFRDYEVFSHLEQEILPTIFQTNPEKTPVKVWVIGCSTGEEAYSMGILLLEALNEDSKRDVMLYATDLDDESLEQAQTGSFPAGIIADVDEDYLLNYFVDDEGCYQAGEKLRNLINFQKHNVITQHPIEKIDLILCRYLTRYFKPETQSMLFRKLHKSLKPNGFLVLGTGETPDDSGVLFKAVDSKLKIFQPIQQEKLVMNGVLSNDIHEETIEPLKDFKLPDLKAVDNPLYETIVRSMLPPSIIIDHDHNLVSVFNNAEKYLTEKPVSEPLKLFEMITPQIHDSLVKLLDSCFKRNRIIRYTIEVSTSEGEELIRLTSTPLARNSRTITHYLITFKEIVTH